LLTAADIPAPFRGRREHGDGDLSQHPTTYCHGALASDRTRTARAAVAFTDQTADLIEESVTLYRGPVSEAADQIHAQWEACGHYRVQDSGTVYDVTITEVEDDRAVLTLTGGGHVIRERLGMVAVGSSLAFLTVLTTDEVRSAPLLAHTLDSARRHLLEGRS
jgi:hypothetical protein